MKIAVVTDSNSGITQIQAKEMGITVLPMPFMIDGETYYEDITLTQEQFYRKLKDNSDISTSQPTPDSIMKMWDKLLKEYDRVILACGAKNPRDIKAPGRDAKGIYFAVDFLKATTKSLLDSELKDGSYISAKGKKVVIIGGGDTGNDCVGTSIRHGCASVTQLEMMPQAPQKRAENNPWPEWPKVLKTDYGQEEAIAVFGHDPRIYQTTVKEFLKDKNGNLCGLVTVKLEPKRDEKTGRVMMTEVAGSEQKMEADLVLIAAGFLGTEKYVADAFGVDLNGRTNVATAEGAYETSVKNVFAAGDVHRGQSLVVWAIREGREVAREVDESLMGYSYLEVQ